MKINVHDSQGLQGELVDMEIISPIPIDQVKMWTFRFTFKNNFVTVVTLDKYELKVLLSVLIGSL